MHPTATSHTKRSFDPIVDAHTRVLVLGSLPGDASLQLGQYYGHPRNQFWRLMEPIVGASLVDRVYPERLAALLCAGVGLWDVIGSATRPGSLDAHIRNAEPNALMDLVGRLPALQLLAFNGAKASQLGRALLGDGQGVEWIALPSSSPAFTAPLETKQAEWNRMQRFLTVQAGLRNFSV
jgi:hypoxanthine-DNA glycosylase